MKIIAGAVLLLILVTACASANWKNRTTANPRTAQSQEEQRVFDNIDDEYLMAKIFFSNEERKAYKSLQVDGEKRLFLDNFWRRNDPNPVTADNEFVNLLKKRIDYCNTYFTHFRAGWSTDRGRIYLKHGEPYEIVKGRTDILAKHGQKDYQIWKYRVNSNMTFIFIDLQTHGDYRLIFSDNDELESSYPDWLEYMGEDFDPAQLY
ncbi:MAG: GWxTD domain-containing protein [Candidatus Cloacimonetes bacterium]|nr:GWxTD domain-containing protein [Candidatus Cloacimonadota bacterium]